jgi:CHAT domain-containing protein
MKIISIYQLFTINRSVRKVSWLVCSYLIFSVNMALASEPSSKITSLERRISALENPLTSTESTVEDPLTGAAVRVELGQAYLQIDAHKKAIEQLIPAVDIYRNQTDKALYANALHLLGKAWSKFGGVHESILSLAKSVAIFRDLGDHYQAQLALATLDLAHANFQAGILELVSIHAKSAQQICHRLTMIECDISAQMLIGDVHFETGDLATASKIFSNSRAILDGLKEKNTRLALEIDARYKLTQAKVLGTKLATDDAIIVFQEIMKLNIKEYGFNSLDVGLNLSQLSQLHIETQEYDLAINEIRQAIAVIEFNQGFASTTLLRPLVVYAQALYKKNNADQMLEQLSRAMALITMDESQRNFLMISNLLTQYSKMKSNPQAAIHFSKRTAEIALYGGRTLRLGNPQLGRNYVATRIKVFRELVLNLLEQNRLIEAQDALDLLKENEYLDVIGEIGNEMRTAKRDSFEEKMRLEFNARVNSYVIAVLNVDKMRRNIRVDQSAVDKENDVHKMHAVETQLVHEKKLLDNYLQEFFKRFQDQNMADRVPPAESIAKSDARNKSIENLGADAATLQYFISEKKLFILFTTPSYSTVKQVNLISTDLSTKIHRFLEAVQNPHQSPTRYGQELYELLIKPIDAELTQHQIKTILISPDSVLKQIPFSALHDGSSYLIQKFNIALNTQSSFIHRPSTPSGGLKIGALGLSQAMKGFRALPGVKAELTGIVKNGKKGIYPGEIILDSKFTENALQQLLEKKYPVLHIASHFIVSSQRESDSFLLLGDGSHLETGQFKKNKFDFTNTDLIVLSACDTATGSKNLNGIEVEGFANVLQTRGAKSVIATQWAIEDKSTSILLPRFYQNLANNQNKVQALSLAQKSFIEQELTSRKVSKYLRGAKRILSISRPFTINSKRPFAHPYYWAGFVLMGNIH